MRGFWCDLRGVKLRGVRGDLEGSTQIIPCPSINPFSPSHPLAGRWLREKGNWRSSGAPLTLNLLGSTHVRPHPYTPLHPTYTTLTPPYTPFACYAHARYVLTTLARLAPLAVLALLALLALVVLTICTLRAQLTLLALLPTRCASSRSSTTLTTTRRSSSFTGSPTRSRR